MRKKIFPVLHGNNLRGKMLFCFLVADVLHPHPPHTQRKGVNWIHLAMGNIGYNQHRRRVDSIK